jgi:hypothetical protein
MGINWGRYGNSSSVNLTNMGIKKVNWRGCPPDLTYINLSGNKITEMNWDGCPTGLIRIILTRNKITEMNWEGCPPRLANIDLGLNKITKMNWKGCPPSLTRIYLYNSDITEMNWDGCPPGLTEIDLSRNEIVEMNWKGCPPGLKEINLDGNKITKMNWSGSSKLITKITPISFYNSYLMYKGGLKDVVKHKLFPLLYNYDSESQKVCDLFKPLNKIELEYVASIYNIDKSLSRVKICNKLGTILQGYITNKKEKIDSCNNTETSIGGDNVKDIPARKFFTYSQSGKVYCEDLEEFHGYIQSGGDKNPFTGVKLVDDIIAYVKDEYNKFSKDMIKKYSEDITNVGYSAHLANLLTKLHYPRDDSWYKALSAVEVINFIKSVPGIKTVLGDGGVRTIEEIRTTGIQELVKFIENNSISPDKEPKKILISQMWNGDI